jgi:hypothetical protein
MRNRKPKIKILGTFKLRSEKLGFIAGSLRVLAEPYKLLRLL